MHDVSVGTVMRFLHKNGYFDLQARKKGLLTTDNVRTRLSYANYRKRNHRKNYWTDHGCHVVCP